MKHLALVLVIALMLSSCTGVVSNEQQIKPRGNTAGNILNYGFVAQQGDWVFFNNLEFTSKNTDNKLVKMKLDGTHQTKIVEDFISFINIAGDWVYYFSHEHDGIYKIRTDGTQLTRITHEEDDGGYFLTLVDKNCIYYTNIDFNGIYKIRTDGTQYTEITVLDCSYFMNVDGDWIYFYNDFYDKEKRGIYKIRTNGKNRTHLINDEIEWMNVVDGWIYFTIKHLEGIHKIRTNGTDRSQIIDDVVIHFNATNDWIYYSNENDNGSLYKVRTDGTERTRIINEKPGLINVLDDWIYYYSSVEEYYGRLFRIRTDGTDRQLVE